MTSTAYLLGLVGAAVVLGVIFELLRRRHLRGKYALLYLGLGVVVTLFAVVPSSLSALARLVGVEVPANLLFFVAIIVLLLVGMQLAYESGRLEEETRVLAEEVALLRLDVERYRGLVGRPVVDGDVGPGV